MGRPKCGSKAGESLVLGAHSLQPSMPLLGSRVEASALDCHRYNFVKCSEGMFSQNLSCSYLAADTSACLFHSLPGP